MVHGLRGSAKRGGDGWPPGGAWSTRAPLADEDIAHYQPIVVAMKETMRLLDGIDEAIEEHESWPIE
jgi:hypothetical protein